MKLTRHTYLMILVWMWTRPSFHFQFPHQRDCEVVYPRNFIKTIWYPVSYVETIQAKNSPVRARILIHLLPFHYIHLLFWCSCFFVPFLLLLPFKMSSSSSDVKWTKTSFLNGQLRRNETFCVFDNRTKSSWTKRWRYVSHPTNVHEIWSRE